MTNWNCDGSGPHTEGEVRVYPLGVGGNLILCRACFKRENQYRIDRRNDHGGAEAATNWPLVDWNCAEVYGE